VATVGVGDADGVDVLVGVWLGVTVLAGVGPGNAVESRVGDVVGGDVGAAAVGGR
jgi:hypothetical protein